MSGLRLEVRTEYMEVHIFKSVSDHPGSTMKGVQAPKAVYVSKGRVWSSSYGAYLSTSKDRNANKIILDTEYTCSTIYPPPAPPDVHTARFLFGENPVQQ